MKLIVGLGNPGGEYDETRHNIGFQVIDELKQQFSHAVFDKKFKGLVARARIGGEDAVLLKPMTYMNLSGESVGPAADSIRFLRKISSSYTTNLILSLGG